MSLIVISKSFLDPAVGLAVAHKYAIRTADCTRSTSAQLLLPEMGHQLAVMREQVTLFGFGHVESQILQPSECHDQLLISLKRPVQALHSSCSANMAGSTKRRSHSNRKKVKEKKKKIKTKVLPFVFKEFKIWLQWRFCAKNPLFWILILLFFYCHRLSCLNVKWSSLD